MTVIRSIRRFVNWFIWQPLVWGSIVLFLVMDVFTILFGGTRNEDGSHNIDGNPGIFGQLTAIYIAFYLACGLLSSINWMIQRQIRLSAPRRILRNRLALIERMPAEYITSDFIQNERNVEVRNALIRKLGIAKFMEMVQAVPGARDDFGQLYSYTVNSRTFAAVKVTNSTIEKDGTFKEYWLRIPPPNARQPERFCVICGTDIRINIGSPKQAIAWTFKLCEPHYNPVMMS